jgi:hypothetical protein
MTNKRVDTVFAGRSWLTHISVGLLVFGLTSSALGEIQLTLKNSFIEKYKNRTSIEAQCVIDHSKGKPNTASADGDMHSAVRCPDEIALPLVAEIMNAKDHLDAIALAKEVEGKGTKVKIKGAWRIWNEHGGDQVFKQGARVAKAETTNPDHVFEIPPVSELGQFDLRASFKPIPGYSPKKAEDAFNRYENTRSQIIPGKLSPKSLAQDWVTTTSTFKWSWSKNHFL